jgi:hypothetical protein
MQLILRSRNSTMMPLGVLVWAGIFLREPRLRALIPLRS